MSTKRLYPAVTIDQDWAGCLRMWQGKDPYPEADVLIQVDIDRYHILRSLTTEERADYDAGHMITTYNIDPAVFRGRVAKAEIRRQAYNEQVYQQLRRDKGK